MAKRLTEEKIEKMAVEIREFLLEHGIWQDKDNQNPRDYFEYVADDHILSMSFEGPVYHMINGYAYGGLVRRFHKIFEKYGVYYEQGDAWNLTCYYT